MSCLWSDQSEFMALLMVFNFWIGPVFNVSIAIFLLLPLDCICIQVYILTHVSVVPVIENN